MQIPQFPEASHPLICSLSYHSDRDLLALFASYPQRGKYFTAIFCRHSSLLYATIAPFARSPQQANYLFALVWRRIFSQLRGLIIKEDGDAQFTSLQNWLVYTAADCLYRTKFPLNESVDYDLETSPLPLQCYLEQALEKLPPLMRFAIVMAEKFRWSDVQITNYLHAQAESLSLITVRAWLEQGYESLQETLPKDIRRIYLE